MYDVNRQKILIYLVVDPNHGSGAAVTSRELMDTPVSLSPAAFERFTNKAVGMAGEKF
jgi:hypothetical protein